MAERWIGVIWVAFAAAILGVLVAAGTSGNAPSGVLLAALVAVPAAVTLVLRRRRTLRGRSTTWPRQDAPGSPRYARSPELAGTAPRPTSLVGSHERLGDADWDVASSICVAIDSRQLDWLRTNDFATPWLDGRARPVIELAVLVASVADRQFEWDIRVALGVLSDAIEPFVAFYNDNTSPDPLLLGEEWWFFERDDLAISDERATGDDLWGGRTIQLHRLAAQVADAYASFISVAAEDPRLGRQLKVPV